VDRIFAGASRFETALIVARQSELSPTSFEVGAAGNIGRILPLSAA